MLYIAKRYQDHNNHVPYTDWISKLRRKNPQAAARIDIRVARATAGNFGDHKFERQGVWALRIDCGPGYRVYYAMDKGAIILLLIGGDKSTQDDDIDKAVGYLNDYHTRLTK